VVFVKVDVDENAETAEFCGIEVMPTFQFFKGSVKVDELVGASEQALKDKIESNK
jgi:thioredoxin 1